MWRRHGRGACGGSRRLCAELARLTDVYIHAVFVDTPVAEVPHSTAYQLVTGVGGVSFVSTEKWGFCAVEYTVPSLGSRRGQRTYARHLSCWNSCLAVSITARPSRGPARSTLGLRTTAFRTAAPNPGLIYHVRESHRAKALSGAWWDRFVP